MTWCQKHSAVEAELRAGLCSSAEWPRVYESAMSCPHRPPWPQPHYLVELRYSTQLVFANALNVSSYRSAKPLVAFILNILSAMFYVFEEINWRWCRHNTVPLSHIRSTVSDIVCPSPKGEGGAGSAPSKSATGCYVPGLIDWSIVYVHCVLQTRAAKTHFSSTLRVIRYTKTRTLPGSRQLTDAC